MSDFSKKQFNSKKTLWKGFGAVLVGAQAVTSILLMVSIITAKILTGQVVAIIGAVLLVLFAMSALKLIFEKNASEGSKTACVAISIVCIIGTVLAFRYSNAFNGFLDKVTTNKEVKEYGVVVLNDSPMKDVFDIKDKNIGFFKNDEKAGNAEQYLQSISKFSSDFYEDLDTLTGVLNNKIVDAIVLETDRIEMLKEEALDSIKDTRIIYTFNIELDSENVAITEREITKEPFVLYISGTDSRAGLRATSRSDVNIIAAVNPKQSKILLVSIPRDTYVQLHATTGIKDKLTHAGVYGITMSKTTIEDFLGIKIDYTAKVSFATVVKMVDELDGIEIDSDQAMTLKETELYNRVCDYKVGKQVVDGQCALRFARERKSYKTGDRHRGENQMQVISAIVAKLSSSKNYVLKLPTILDIAADSFETSLTRDDISAFIRMQLNDSPKWEIEQISVDGTGSMQGTYSMGANRPLYVMIADPATVTNATNKINEYLK